MKREFQAVYRARQTFNSLELAEMAGRTTGSNAASAMLPMGDLLTGLFIGESGDEITAMLVNEGFHVVRVTELRAVVDWSKPNFDRDEAAAYLAGIAANTLSVNKGNGQVPFAEIGKGFYPRKWLDAWIEKSANKAARAIVEELKAA